MSRLRLTALATHVDVDSPAPAVEAAVRTLAGHLGAECAAVSSDEPAGSAVVRVSGHPGSWWVEAAGDLPAIGPLADLEPLLVAAVTRSVVEATPLLGVHAGVVQGKDGLVVVPGDSGQGKTTLVAALVQRGWGYLSDEVLGVDRESGQVHAFRRPLAIGHDAWPVLGLDGRRRPEPGGEAYVHLQELGVAGEPAPVRHVVLTARRPGPPRITAGRPGDAVAALLRRSFNHFREPEASLRAVLGLVHGALVWQSDYDDATELAEHLSRHGWRATDAK